jgi:Spy/CpxP family protein refolding chaperone
VRVLRFGWIAELGNGGGARASASHLSAEALTDGAPGCDGGVGRSWLGWGRAGVGILYEARWPFEPGLRLRVGGLHERATMLDRVASLLGLAAGGNLLKQMTLWTVVLGGALCLGMNVAAVAQDAPAQPQTNNQTQAQQGASQQGAPQQGAPQPPTMQQRMAGITQALSLTDAQQQQVYPLLQQAQQKMQALVADNSTPINERQAQADMIRKNLRTQIAAVLTPEQRQKLEAMTTRAPNTPPPSPPHQ